MQKRNQFDNTVIDLAAESFNNVRPYSVEVALARGVIVEVTDWVMPDIGFGKSCFRSRVVLTARLWDTLLQTYVRLRNGQADDEACKKRNDVLWLAAQALKRAESVGLEAANFDMHWPSEEESYKRLRVESFERVERKCRQVTVGFPEDFVRL